MCPTGGIGLSLALGALKTGFSFMAQQSQAKAQLKYQTELANQRNQYMVDNAQAANAAYVNESASENIRIGQEQEQEANEIREAQKETHRAAGTALATSEGTGSGQLIDIFRQFGSYRNNLETNLKWEIAQSGYNQEGYRSKAHSRANSVRPYTPQPVNFPSPLAAAASFAGSAFSQFKPT